MKKDNYQQKSSIRLRRSEIGKFYVLTFLVVFLPFPLMALEGVDTACTFARIDKCHDDL